MNFIDLFAGVGGFHLAFQGKADCVYVSEWNAQAQKTYKANFDNEVNGDITKIDPNDLPNFDILTAGFPCFAAGTLVNTMTGFKPIEQIKKDEYVLTHTGQYKKVLSTMKKETNNIFNLKIMGSETIKVTSEHPFYTLSDNTLIWKEVKDLKKGDKVAININKDAKDYIWEGIEVPVNQNTKELKNTMQVRNEHFWWLVGRYVADGWRIQYKRKGRKNSFITKVIICCGHHENIDMEIKNAGLKATKSLEKTAYKYHISNSEFYEFLKPFGNYAYGKKIPKEVLHLPINLLQAFFDGYISGDGYIKNNIIQYTTISPYLSYGFQQIIHKLYGVASSLTITEPKERFIQNRFCKTQKCYTVRTHLKTHLNHSEIFDNYILVPVRRNEQIEFNDYVYNLEVEEDNSYCVNNIIVHNCQPFSIAGQQLGFDHATQGNLFFNILSIIDVKRPQVLFLENVKNLVSHDNGNTFKTICSSLEERGYHLRHKVLNGKKYGNTPQNRERIFIIGFLDSEKANKFNFPEEIPLTKTILDCLESNIPDKYYQTNMSSPAVQKMHEGMSNHDRIYQYRRFYVRENKEGVCPTLTANMGSGGHNVPLILDEKGIRKLTPRECFNFQGFPTDFILPNIADSHLYHQAGNAVVVPLITRIANNIILALE